MSACGTKWTWQSRWRMSAFGGIADVGRTRRFVNEKNCRGTACSFRKFHPAQIRVVRQNHYIIRIDVCDPAWARNVRRRHVLLLAFSRDIGLCVLSATSKINMKMDETQPNPHPLQRNVMLVLLLALAAAAWAVLVWEHTNAAMDMTMASPDIGLRAPLVLAMWVVVMMVAMMKNAQLRADLRPPSKRARLPTPVPTKAGPMPTDEGLGTDDRNDLQDRRKPSIQLDEEEAITIRKPDALMHHPAQHNHLMSERNIFGFKSALRPEWRDQDGKDKT